MRGAGDSVESTRARTVRRTGGSVPFPGPQEFRDTRTRGRTAQGWEGTYDLGAFWCARVIRRTGGAPLLPFSPPNGLDLGTVCTLSLIPSCASLGRGSRVSKISLSKWSFGALTNGNVTSRARRAARKANHRLWTKLSALLEPSSSQASRWQLHLLAFSLERQGRRSRAEGVYRQLLANAQDSALLWRRLAAVLRRQRKTWQEIEALEALSRLRPRSAMTYYRLGVAHQTMEHLSEAAEAFRKAVELRPRMAQWHYRRGYSLEKLGDMEGAAAAYAESMRRDRSLDSARFGIGVYHQRLGLWSQAAGAYEARTLDRPDDPELHYRWGTALDRCYRWSEAAEAYERATTLDPGQHGWFGRLGFVYERCERWASAADAYERAARAGKGPARFWWYRRGYCLVQLQRYREACTAFRQSRPPFEAHLTLDSNRFITGVGNEQGDPRNPFSFLRLAEAFEARRDWTRAAEHFRQTVSRLNSHDPDVYFRMGRALEEDGNAEAACEAYLSTRILRRHPGVSDTGYRRNAGLKRVADYNEYLQTLAIQDKTILYESFHGRSMSCNPYAIFRHALGRNELTDWTHVWVLDDVAQIPEHDRELKNVVFVLRESDLYLRYLASAKYLINNTSFPSYFVRREDQHYLNTWHGTPIKLLGRDVPSGLVEWGNLSRNFLLATHLIAGNEHTARVMLERFQIADTYRGSMRITGYPRIDHTLNISSEDRENLKRRLGIPAETTVVLYAPTFRGTVANAELDQSRIVEDIEKLQALGCHVLFRGHYFTEDRLSDSTVGRSVVPGNIDTNLLLGITDVLVTDYSSIAIDFLATKRPIVHYVYDLEEYQRDRGLYFPLSELPGDICLTRDELLTAVGRHLAAPLSDSRQYEAACERFCPREEGRSSDRVVDLFLLGRDEARTRPAKHKKSVLVFGGPFSPTGITTSLITLLTKIDPERYSVTLVVEPARIKESPDRVEQFRRVPSHVQVLARVGRMLTSLDERWVIDQFSKNNDLDSSEMWMTYLSTFRREFRRTFGDARFDVVINFDGYGHFWPSLLACATSGRRIMYQHANMYREWQSKYPSLAGTFRLYRHYDALVSVSPSTREQNFTEVSRSFPVSEIPHLACENPLDTGRIVEAAQVGTVEEDLDSVFVEPGMKFITIGRLSPEKDHEKLIRAFAGIHAEAPDAKLIILGDGPLRARLEIVIRELGLEANVVLGGYRSNPFPYLARAHCFVLSSVYEGQGLVLLEAMVLGIPVVATDIPSAREILRDGRGLIVSNDEAGLLQGMRHALRGEIPTPEFDGGAYEQRALDAFYRTVVEGEITRAPDERLELR